jgi:hypothetical protein
MSESWERGRKAEGTFQKVMFEKWGIPVVKSSEEEDIHKHIDFYIGGQSYDVKGLRSIRRGETPQEDLVYIELSNVMGKKGWLFGESDFIVFEQIDTFALVPRIKLVEVVRELLHHNSTCDKPELYKIYSRKGRDDRITLIRFKDLLLCEPTIIRKK